MLRVALPLKGDRGQKDAISWSLRCSSDRQPRHRTSFGGGGGKSCRPRISLRLYYVCFVLLSFKIVDHHSVKLKVLLPTFITNCYSEILSRFQKRYMFCVFWKLFYIFLVYTPVKVKFLITQPVRCTQALRMQWWLQICHQENQERQSTIIVRTIWNRLEALISSSTGGSGANIWFLEGKRYFDRLVFKNEMTPAFLGAGLPENRTKVFPMQEFQQHHSNNQMQGQWGCI